MATEAWLPEMAGRDVHLETLAPLQWISGMAVLLVLGLTSVGALYAWRLRRSLKNSAFTVKNVRLRRIGPLSTPPNVFRRSGVFGLFGFS